MKFSYSGCIAGLLDHHSVVATARRCRLWLEKLKRRLLGSSESEHEDNLDESKNQHELHL